MNEISLAQAPDRVQAMTAQEKVDLLSGYGMWKTAAVERLGIPSITMTDGTYGVRYSIPQIDGDEKGGADLNSFLSVVNQRASDIAVAWGEMKPATCFPNGSAMGNSWDIDLMRRLGTLLGRECRAMGVDMLLGPGINIRRHPLAGRAYEYYSEDPLLTGHLAAAVIDGLQFEGVGTSLKHFACNNSEIERTTMDSVVEERALREIYLKGFEIAIRRSQPWTVMSSYNRLNGRQTSEDGWLLNDVLRNDWGYDGVVVSDWHGIKDRPASIEAGGDLDMPESPRRKNDLLAAIKGGTVSTDAVDLSCRRVLDLVDKAVAGRANVVRSYDAAAHHAEARAMAGASMVLVKNQGVLPIPTKARNILVVGEGATTPVIQGSGCATTMPTIVDGPLDELKAILGPAVAVTCVAEANEDALRLAESVDLVIVFASTEGAYDGEGSDRTTLALGPGQDDAIARLAAVTSSLAVVIACPDAVAMPWIDEVGAVLVSFYSGQAMGGAAADILTGRVNPSGKLAVTFPKRLEDVPGHFDYPGERGRHVYSEGIHVGYRGYDLRGTEPLFPFGHGRSYTKFDYADLELSTDAVRHGDGLIVGMTVTNVGDREGSEIVQVYLRAPSETLHRSPQELKGFAKVRLAPGESQRVSIEIEAGALGIWDPSCGRWVLEATDASIAVAASSRDVRLEAPLQLVGSILPHRRLAYDTQPAFVLSNPIARDAIRDYLAQRFGLGEDDAARALQHCSNSFFGIFTTLERRLRLSITERDVTELMASVNRSMDEAERHLWASAACTDAVLPTERPLDTGLGSAEAHTWNSLI